MWKLPGSELKESRKKSWWADTTLPSLKFPFSTSTFQHSFIESCSNAVWQSELNKQTLLPLHCKFAFSFSQFMWHYYIYLLHRGMMVQNFSMKNCSTFTIAQFPSFLHYTSTKKKKLRKRKKLIVEKSFFFTIFWYICSQTSYLVQIGIWVFPLSLAASGS